ncbi:MAG: DUF2828 family protein [Firmicutes bacterium]|nr:DUF2828 family protein [Bacillota bacterium]
MLEILKNEANTAFTENGAVTYETSGSDCLDLFASVGAIRRESDSEIISRFIRAYAENKDTALKILFFARDIRGGLGERRVFRVIINWLAENEPKVLVKNLRYIAEYGRFDDLLPLIGTRCESEAMAYIRKQLDADLAASESGGDVSLLAKWLPSVNTSNRNAVKAGKKIARALGMNDAAYRKALVKLRGRIKIIENNLREKDYTFDYAKQPSKAMLKYRAAFYRNDKERYCEFLNSVENGTEKINTSALAPYEIIAPCFQEYGDNALSEQDIRSMDIMWRNLKDFGNDENALAVIDGSGSMYRYENPIPEAVALSLGIYYAERNKGAFKNHFITFSEKPRLVEIKGDNIAEKVRYCMQFNEVANTDILNVFKLILNAALKNNVPQSEMPATLYIVSDMEFDCCADNAEVSNFEYAKGLYEENGYTLPKIVFWNVACRNRHQPVTKNEQGAVLVSGCTPRLFEMTAGGNTNPYQMMMEVVSSKRYEPISA